MKLTKNQSKKLKKNLPNGWGITIKERLEAKGEEFSESTILSVVYGNRYNSIILEEAIRLKEEHQAKIKELKNRI